MSKIKLRTFDKNVLGHLDATDRDVINTFINSEIGSIMFFCDLFIKEKNNSVEKLPINFLLYITTLYP